MESSQTVEKEESGCKKAIGERGVSLRLSGGGNLQEMPFTRELPGAVYEG